MIEMVQLWTSFILSSRSLEIGSPPTGGARRIKLFCIGHTNLTHLYILKKGGMQSYGSNKEEEMWWNHLDFTLYF